MPPISRRHARDKGLKRYFTGKPCVRGHVAERTVSASDCVECLVSRQKAWNEANRKKLNERSRDWYAANKVKAAVTRANWRARNADKVRADVAAYQAANKERLTRLNAIWAKNNPDKTRAARLRYHSANKENIRRLAREWAARNKHKINAKKARRLAAIIQATPAWASAKAIHSICAEASRLTRETGVPHHVDHAIPLRSKVVCGLHCEANLQVLRGEDNQRKTNRFPLDAAA